MASVKLLCMCALLLALCCCGSTREDLYPSGKDKRPTVQAGTIGPAVGQQAPDFTLPDIHGNPTTLSASAKLPTAKGVVIYFTMWCPTCDSEMSNMRDAVMPRFPNVIYYAVDYVSGSFDGARNSELDNGYAGSGFTTLVDTSQSVLNQYQATMSTTVVIDSAGVVRMNENYKDGAKLQEILGGLP